MHAIPRIGRTIPVASAGETRERHAAITMGVYAHLLKGQQRQAAEALDHLIART
jgi:hypothetical protein